MTVPSDIVSAIFFSDSLTGFVASGQSVYKTIDGAKTWKQVNLPAGILSLPYEISFTSLKTGYIGFQNNKIAKTTDGGETWVRLKNDPPSGNGYHNSFSFADDTVGYAVSNYYLYKTSDGGNSWTVTAAPYGAQSVFAVNRSVAYIASSFDTYKTSDGGASWSGSYWNSGLMYFTNPDDGLIFSDYSEIFKKTTGSEDFMQTYHSSKFVFSWYRISFAEDFGCALGGDNSIVVTNDGGSSWKLFNRTEHFSFSDTHFSSTTEGLILGNNGGILRTDDNTRSWYFDEHVPRDDYYQMAFSDLDTGIVVTTNNYAFHTYDGGKSFVQEDWTPPIIGHLQSYDYEMVSSKIIYSVGSKVKVTKSVDGGKSWTPFDFEFSNSISTIKCTDAKTCHAAGAVGMVISTWDGGDHWKVNNLLLNNDLVSIQFINSSLGFVGGTGGVILRTDNGGQSWTILYTGASWSVISFHFINDEKGYAVTEGGEVLYTKDKGLNWEIKEFNSSIYNFSHSFTRDTSSIYGIGEDGGIYRWTPRSDVIKVVTGTEPKVTENTIKVFPNPFSNSLFFDSSDNINEITIIDVRGVTQKHSQENVRYLDTADLPPGIYIAQITYGQNIQTVKIFKH